MALQKQQISLDLISGTETKVNGQINDKNQDMINVVFSGDTTAKKMNGYDLLATLPAGEYYSSLFVKGQDLLAQSEKGSYKYYENITAFKKISPVGSSVIDTVPSYGEVFCGGANYDLHIGFTTRSTFTGFVATTHYYLVQTFTDKNGSVLNTIESEVNTLLNFPTESHVFNWIQVVESNNCFFILKLNTSRQVVFEKYIFDLSSNAFQSMAILTFNGSGNRAINYESIVGSDIYTDGTYLYWAERDVSASPGCEIYKLDFSTLAIVTNATFGAGLVYSSVKISARDANSFYVSHCAFNYLGTPGIMPAYLIQNYYLKGTLALIPPFDNILATENATAGSSGAHFTSYPLSDSTCKYVFHYVSDVASSGNIASPGYTFDSFKKSDSFFGTTCVPGLAPVGEIFTENGSYYLLCVSTVGINQVYVVMNVDLAAPVATMDASKVSQNDYFKVINYNLTNVWGYYLYAFKKMYAFRGKWILPTKDKVDLVKNPVTRLFTLGLNASSISTQIEMGKKTSVFNGQPAYYDGIEFTEAGFNNKPFLINTTTAITGGFLSNGTYQIVAVYKWKDSTGDIFYSDLSNIIGSTYPLILSGGGPNQKISFDLHSPLISTKKNVEVIVYVKKDSAQFVKNQSIFIVANGPSNLYGKYGLGISAYVAPGIQETTLEDIFLYATSTFAAGGDYPTSAITNCLASAIYEDRIFFVSRDNPSTLSYSQKRLPGIGPEFNQDIFNIDIYDKRGVYEDKLTGLIGMDGRLFIFKERSVLYLTGSGPSRANTQNDFSSPQLVTTDVGCTYPKSIVLTPEGIMFMSDKGLYLLNRKLQVSYIGSSVERFNARIITSAILLEKVNEIRFGTLEGEILVFNYYSRAWSWFTNLPSVSACIWKGKYTLLLSDGRIFSESSTHKKIVQGGVSSAILQKISSPWVIVDKKQGWEKVYQALLLGDFKSDHQVKVSFYYDYEKYASDIYTIDPLASSQYNLVTRPTNSEIESGAKTDGVYQIAIDMVRKNCQAFRMEIEDIPLNISSNTGEGFALSNISVTFGAKKGPSKTPDAKSY